jgi:putative protease
MAMMDELEGLANRGYTEGFYRRHPPKEYQNYERGVSRSDRQQFVGEILDCREDWLTIDVKNRFGTGDRLELVTPGGNHAFVLESLTGRDGKPADIAPGSGHVVRFRMPEAAAGLSMDHALLVRHLPRGTEDNPTP